MHEGGYRDCWWHLNGSHENLGEPVSHLNGNHETLVGDLVQSRPKGAFVVMGDNQKGMLTHPMVPRSPFILIKWIEQQEIVAMLDTGADFSLVSADKMPENMRKEM